VEYLPGNGDHGHLEGDAAAVLITSAPIRSASSVASVRRKAVDSVGRHRDRIGVRKIAIRITMTAITTTEVFVSVKNVRYVCS
jgi:hypothetical protein